MPTKAQRPTSRYERQARALGYLRVAGVDEAGRGPLFGPVYAAAVILVPGAAPRGLRDSKLLTAERRETLAARVKERALAWAVASAEAAEIDRLNIFQASRLAMRRAVEALSPPAGYLLIDAVSVDLPLPQKAIIHGDALSPSIAAASILAKVARDAAMARYDRLYPGYGFAHHKGYPTPGHLQALERLGPTPEHRRSYAPVRAVCPGCERQLSLWSAEGAACS